MRTRRGIVRTRLSWLALVATVVANVPHFDCVCPNGDRKPFCLTFSFSGTACCTGEGCCRTDDQPFSGDGVRPGCPKCHAAAERTSSGATIKAPVSNCQKTFVAGADVAANPSDTDDDRLPAAAVLPPPSTFVAVSDTGLMRGVSNTSASRRLPSPPALVVTLCHFVI